MLYLNEEDAGVPLSSAFDKQKGAVHGHTTSQDISGSRSRSDPVTVALKLVNHGCIFGLALSTGESRGRSFGSHHLPTAAALLLTRSIRAATRILQEAARIVKQPGRDV